MILLESLHHISLGCADLEKTAHFYENILGFDVTERGETHLVVYVDPIGVRFNLIEGYEPSSSQPGEASLAYILDVDDFTDAINNLEEQDIEIVEGPLAIEGGESLLIQDPDGHYLECFYQD